MTVQRISVRPATIADSSSISHVCLLTANQGLTAEDRVRHPALPGRVRALPYLHLPSGFAFVLVESTKIRSLEIQKIVGYVVGTAHASQFELEAEASWWPILRMKYPKDLAGTPLDRYYVDVIHKNARGSAEGTSTRISPANLHVNVIRKYQQLGCDRLLLDVALHHLRVQGCSGNFANTDSQPS